MAHLTFFARAVRFMAIESVPAFLDALRQCRLLADVQLQLLDAQELAAFKQPHELAKDLVRRGWLTRFQARHLIRGQGQELCVGPYRLLDRVGEGGMGQVYKALHQPMNRIVALKIVRPDLIADPVTLKRFHREVQAAAYLSHSNIVAVFDASQIGDKHFLAMEYIDGTDLSALVKSSGPLSIESACDYIRQTALGLHHAHERGLLHRDVKPSNLLVTRNEPKGVVKILDMGLARRVPIGLSKEEVESGVTIDGTVVGTPDFMSPEQAKNSRAVDLRADVYSLGCTLYYVLTGQPPFPKGTVMEKLLQHQLEEPRPVEQVRESIPNDLALIVHRMLAKKPEDRFQSINDVAAALAPFCGKAGVATLPVGPTPQTRTSAPTLTLASAAAPSSASGSGVGTMFRFDSSMQNAVVKAPAPKPNRPVAPLAGAAAAGIAIVLALFVIVMLTASKKNVVATTTPERLSAEKSRAASTTAAVRPLDADEFLAASVQENASAVFVVDAPRLLRSDVWARHFRAPTAPMFQALAAHGVDPQKGLDRVIVSLDTEAQPKSLVICHGNRSLRSWHPVFENSAASKKMELIDKSTLDYLVLTPTANGRENYLAFLDDSTLAVASDPKLLVGAAARLQRKAENSGNEFLMRQLHRTGSEATIRFALLGRFRFDDDSLDSHGLRSLVGEIQCTDTVSLAGHARVQDSGHFEKGWRDLAGQLSLGALLRDRQLALPALLMSKAKLTASATREAGFIDVQFFSKPDRSEMDTILRAMVKSMQ
jgi:serine/threonine-protein kinase